MTIEVEDGTAKANAESYASVADADTFHSNRGNTLWATMATAEKEQALRRGTDYMEQVYRERWEGVRGTITQALSWPRAYVEYPDVADFYPTSYYPDDEVPTEVVNACAEIAFKAASGELAPDIDRVTSREKLGPMEVQYKDSGKPYKTYRSIDNMLAVWLESTGGAFKKLVRT